jgi:hypothetical protein
MVGAWKAKNLWHAQCVGRCALFLTFKLISCGQNLFGANIDSQCRKHLTNWGMYYDNATINILKSIGKVFSYHKHFPNMPILVMFCMHAWEVCTWTDVQSWKQQEMKFLTTHNMFSIVQQGPTNSICNSVKCICRFPCIGWQQLDDSRLVKCNPTYEMWPRIGVQNQVHICS